MKQTYNLKDVALMAGVSLGTASKVINNIYVKPESRLRVETAMINLNYTPNAIARSLKANTTKTIGVMIPDISSPVVGKVLKGIEDAGRKGGYSILIYDTALNRIIEEDAVKTFTEKKVDGILYSGNTVTDEIAARLKNAGVPVVFTMTGYEDKSGDLQPAKFGNSGSAKYGNSGSAKCGNSGSAKCGNLASAKFFSSVTIDNKKAAYKAVEYLCSYGHERILMLAGEQDDPNSGIPRLEGYKEALADLGISLDEELILCGGYRLNRGYEDTKKALKAKKDFTAIFAASDDVAIGAMKALAEAGLSVPHDVSVMGFDGIDMISYTVPSLATISQPFYQLGVESTNILINRLENGKNNMNLYLPFELIKNDSVGKCRKT